MAYTARSKPLENAVGGERVWVGVIYYSVRGKRWRAGLFSSSVPPSRSRAGDAGNDALIANGKNVYFCPRLS